MISNSILWLTVLIKQAINIVMERKKNHYTQLGLLAEGPSWPIWATCFTSVGNPICISGSFSSAKLSICSYSTSFTSEYLKFCRYSNAENSHFPLKNGLWKNLGTHQTFGKCILNLLEDPSFLLSKMVDPLAM